MNMPESPNRPLRVFLCHSSNDKPLVRELYQKLCAEDWIKPWLDEEELYPGQDWNLEIEKAVEAADVILVCLSNNSVNKEGYVQRELRLVLDYADYKPEGTLYIIPVRLEECEPPRRLRPWQYADYFPKEGRERAFQRLLVSLRKRADSLGLEPVGRASGPTISVPNISDPPSSNHAESVTYETGLEHGTTKQSDPETSEERELPFELKNPGYRVEDMPQLIFPPPSVDQTPALAPGASVGNLTYKNKITLSNGMEFMRVPAGPFLMGSSVNTFTRALFIPDNEKPQHTVVIPYNYWLARYPVTNEQYNAYVKSQGIRHPVDGWEGKRDHPVTNVWWAVCSAYCRWLNELIKIAVPSGSILRLPTEAEWEKGARGEGGTEYPWGNEFATYPMAGNYDPFVPGIGVTAGATTPVGAYSPHGDSPFGCADMAGNVWEFTHSLMKAYPYTPKDGREDEGTSGSHVLRGACMGATQSTVRSATRIDDTLLDSRTAGFRVVLAPPIDEVIKLSK
ncbi:MAG: SUMF1/EgtB/PvdO family nonheme iron enzyme [Chloroflexota bacterium]